MTETQSQSGRVTSCSALARSLLRCPPACASCIPRITLPWSRMTRASWRRRWVLGVGGGHGRPGCSAGVHACPPHATLCPAATCDPVLPIPGPPPHPPAAPGAGTAPAPRRQCGASVPVQVSEREDGSQGSWGAMARGSSRRGGSPPLAPDRHPHSPSRAPQELAHPAPHQQRDKPRHECLHSQGRGAAVQVCVCVCGGGGVQGLRAAAGGRCYLCCWLCLCALCALLHPAPPPQPPPPHYTHSHTRARMAQGGA